MPIFADRNPQGKLTGRFRAQVRRQGKNIKSPRFETYDEAKAWEARERHKDRFISAHVSLDPHQANGKKETRPKQVVTLGDLHRKATGVIWRGQPSEVTSENRIRIIVEMLGPDMKLSDITTETIDMLTERLFKRRVSATERRYIKGSTVNRFLSCFRHLLDWAERRQFIDTLPKFDWQEEEQGRIRWITRREEDELYRLLPEKYGRLVRVAIKTGMRRGELLGLKSDQIEPRKVHLWKTKTKTPRTIPIDKETHANLMWLLEHKMPNEHELRWAWDAARAKMNLTDDPYFVFHVCRHTCATRLVEANVNLRVIQKWLGHKRIETTIRYAQVKDSMLEDALTKLSTHDETRVDFEMTTTRTDEIRQGLLVKNKTLQIPKVVVDTCGRGGTGRRAGFRLSQQRIEILKKIKGL